MSNIYRDQDGEHYKLTDYRGDYAVLRSLAHDSTHLVRRERMELDFIKVVVTSQDLPVTK